MNTTNLTYQPATDIEVAQYKIGAGVVVDAAKKQYNMELDYSEESIERVDELIEELSKCGWPDDEKTDKLLSIIGFYIGEVVVRNISGIQWAFYSDEDHKEPVLCVAMTPNGGALFVIKWVFSRYKNGKEDYLPHKYQVGKMMLEGRLPLKGAA